MNLLAALALLVILGIALAAISFVMASPWFKYHDDERLRQQRALVPAAE